MQAIAQDWLILDLTGNSGGALGIATALQFLPPVAFGLWGGLIADRYSKRRVLTLCQVAMGTLALILGALAVAGVVRIWEVYAFAFALGLAQSVNYPAQQSLMAELVEPAYRASAFALTAVATSCGRIVGPAIAGLLIDIAGVGPVYFVNALSFAAVIVGLKAMREDELHAAPRTSRMKGQLRAGLAYVRGRRDLVLIFILVALVSTFGMNPQVTTALMTKDVFRADAGAFGLASTVFAVGTLTGALLAAQGGTPGRRRVIVAALAFGILEAGSALLPTYTSFLALLPPTGVTMTIFNMSTVVMIQFGVPADIRGRAAGLYYVVVNGTTPIGAPLIGWIAQTFGGRAGLFVGGTVTALATLAVAPLLARHGTTRAAERSTRRHDRADEQSSVPTRRPS